MTTFTAACIQMNAQDDLDANMRAAESFIREAKRRNADFITLPEVAFYMSAPGSGPSPSHDPAIALCRTLARELSVWILLGSVHVPVPDSTKSFNRSLLI